MIEKGFDLEVRTLKFAKEVLIFCKSISMSVISNSIIAQLIKSATSIGANYMEANGASSKKDFQNKIYICRKESQETKYWLKVLETLVPEKEPQLKKLGSEVQELILIFSKINRTIKNDKVCN